MAANCLKIVLFAANPFGDLKLDDEVRWIEDRLDDRDLHRIELVPVLATTPGDLIDEIGTRRPQIVQFSGHGIRGDAAGSGVTSPKAGDRDATRELSEASAATDASQLVLIGDDQRPQPVGKRGLVSLFKLRRDVVRIVVLNACGTREQAEAIAEYVDCVVGTDRSIQDAAARIFAARFYRSLAQGNSVATAFEEARIELELQGFEDQSEIPRLFCRFGIDPAAVYLVPPKGEAVSTPTLLEVPKVPATPAVSAAVRFAEHWRTLRRSPAFWGGFAVLAGVTIALGAVLWSGSNVMHGYLPSGFDSLKANLDGVAESAEKAKPNLSRSALVEALRTHTRDPESSFIDIFHNTVDDQFARPTAGDLREFDRLIAEVVSDRRNRAPSQSTPTGEISKTQPLLITGAAGVLSDHTRPGSRASWRDALWPQWSTLRVKFLDAPTDSWTQYVHDRAIELARQWTEGTNLTLEFFEKGERGDFDITIRLLLSRPNEPASQFTGTYSQIGVASRTATPSMSLAFPETYPQLATQRQILHEFGHALGLIEEHQNPKANIRWDTPAVMRFYGGPPYFWTSAIIEQNVLQTHDYADYADYRDFDSESVMIYAFPHGLTTNGFASEDNVELSTIDREFIRQLYPRNMLVAGSPSVPGAITKRGQVDHYKFRPESQGLYTIEARGSTNVELCLFGPDDAHPVTRDNDGTPAWSPRIVRRLEPGQYSLHVRPRNYEATGPYEVHATFKGD